MSTATPESRALYARLEEVLGTEHADTLMTYLPPHPATELATRPDIADLKADIAELKQGLDRVHDRIDALHYSLADQLKTYTIVMVSALTALTAILGVTFAVIFS